MAEINNNIPNFGHKIEKVNTQGTKPQQKNAEITGETKSPEYTADTGVLGRSQVTTKGTDINKSVDEAVNLAKKQPTIICSCETIFDKFYKENLENGMSESDAYMNALLAEEEFMNIAHHHCNH